MFITRSWILLAVLGFGAAQNEVTKPCNITKDIQGECIAISLCPRAILIIQMNRFDLLKNITCGFDKLDAKVCCETNKTDSAIIFKNSTEETAAQGPDWQAKPTVALSPDLARTDRTSTRQPTAPRIPTTTLTYTTPYPLTTQQIQKETKSSTEDVILGNQHGGTGAAPTVEYDTGREPDQSEISPPLPSTHAQSELPPSNSNPNLVPPPSLQYPVDILPNRNVCGLMDTSDRIYGGQLAGIDELPWLVRIKYLMPNLKETYACHGSLITDRFVLTAAHCVFRKKIIEVRLGEWDADTDVDCVKGDCSDPPVDVKVEGTYVHPTYNRTLLVGDIALLRLATPVNFTAFIQPVCLPVTDTVARQDYDLDHEYLTGGWGQTEYETRAIVKRKVKLSPVAMNTCRVAIKSITDEVAASTICAGGRLGEDSCAGTCVNYVTSSEDSKLLIVNASSVCDPQDKSFSIQKVPTPLVIVVTIEKGDSGSSLVKQTRENRYINWFIYGITSFGPRICGMEGYPGIYTRVTHYMDWILGVLVSSPK